MAALFALFGLSFAVGVVAERIRKLHDMKLDAERGVTFIGSVPYVFKRYGPEQNYPAEGDA